MAQKWTYLAAHERGVCVREDMLSLLDKAALQSLVEQALKAA